MLVEDAIQQQVGDLGAILGHRYPDQVVDRSEARYIHGAGHGGCDVVTTVALGVVV